MRASAQLADMMFNSVTGLPDQISMYSRSKNEAYKTGDKTSPISVILVSSGSRGNKLLFRYPFQRVAECPSSPAGGVALSSKRTRQTLSALIFSFSFFFLELSGRCRLYILTRLQLTCLLCHFTSIPFDLKTCLSDVSDIRYTQLWTFTCWKTLIKPKRRLFEIGI